MNPFNQFPNGANKSPFKTAEVHALEQKVDYQNVIVNNLIRQVNDLEKQLTKVSIPQTVKNSINDLEKSIKLTDDYTIGLVKRIEILEKVVIKSFSTDKTAYNLTIDWKSTAHQPLQQKALLLICEGKEILTAGFYYIDKYYEHNNSITKPLIVKFWAYMPHLPQ